MKAYLYAWGGCEGVCCGQNEMYACTYASCRCLGDWQQCWVLKMNFLIRDTKWRRCNGRGTPWWFALYKDKTQRNSIKQGVCIWYAFDISASPRYMLLRKLIILCLAIHSSAFVNKLLLFSMPCGQPSFLSRLLFLLSPSRAWIASLRVHND